MALPPYTIYFRGKPACTCLAKWLPVFEAELQRRGVLQPGQQISIAQLIGSASASANTHSTGGAFDIWQHDETTVEVARQMGADATWARTTGSFANNRHAHGVLTDCPHNGAARYQIDEVRAGGDGLVGNAPDPGPRPLSGRTWREGIAWALEQQEEAEMARYEDQLDSIEAKIDRLAKAEQRRNVADIERVRRIVKKIVGVEATTARIEKAIADLEAEA